MLYLFGQLALSDSLSYHENFDVFDCSVPVATYCPEQTAASTHALAADQPRHCWERRFSQAGRPATNQQG